MGADQGVGAVVGGSEAVEEGVGDSDQELTPWAEVDREEVTPADGSLSLLTFSFSLPVYDSF